MEQLRDIVVEMIRQHPDPNGPRPISNYPATMYGVTITFHVLSWVAVGLRLHTRLRIVREPWWDDLFVFLAAIFNLPTLIAFLGGIKYGLGHHLAHVLGLFREMLKYLYVTNAAYHTCAALIKISLLLQYLRLFRKGFLRYLTIILLVTVSSWGLAFSFLAWFPCLPVSGFWHRTAQSKCYGFGYRTITEAKITLLVFASTNMFFDLVIFLMPLSEYFRPGLRKKQLLAMTGLFAMGFVVVLMSILRLWSTFKHSKDAIQGFDITWWYPEVLIFSCLEVDFAILCASMPIFWPTVVTNWNAIFVTKEVHVVHQDRVQDFEMGRPTSLKSTVSQEGLTKLPSGGQKSYYYNDFGDDASPGKSPALSILEHELPSRPVSR